MYNNLEYIKNDGAVWMWRIKSTGFYRVVTPNSITTFKNRNDAEDVYRYYVPVYREMMQG